MSAFPRLRLSYWKRRMLARYNNRWSVRFHRAHAKRQLERYGLDVAGSGPETICHRARMRNARKQEAACRR